MKAILQPAERESSYGIAAMKTFDDLTLQRCYVRSVLEYLADQIERTGERHDLPAATAWACIARSVLPMVDQMVSDAEGLVRLAADERGATTKGGTR